MLNETRVRFIDEVRSMDNSRKDIHERLLSFGDIKMIIGDSLASIFSYCIGYNESGREIFQIYSKEFIEELSKCINKIIKTKEGPVLEVCCGDGKFTEFLSKYIDRTIIPTDNKSYEIIRYPEFVINMDAIDAINYYKPSLVLLSWEHIEHSISKQIIDMGIPLLWIGHNIEDSKEIRTLLNYGHITLELSHNLNRIMENSLIMLFNITNL